MVGSLSCSFVLDENSENWREGLEFWIGRKTGMVRIRVSSFLPRACEAGIVGRHVGLKLLRVEESILARSMLAG